MDFYIDFNSDEAIYIQLCNQIIMNIATDQIKEGDSLPSVRQMADLVGINMHTVNKAYSILKREGFIKLDRRKGAIICIDVDKLSVLAAMKRDLQWLWQEAYATVYADRMHIILLMSCMTDFYIGRI